MGHLLAGAVAVAIPVALIIFAFSAFLINTIRGSRSDRSEKEKIEHAPKPPQRPLPRKLRDVKKR